MRHSKQTPRSQETKSTENSSNADIDDQNSDDDDDSDGDGGRGHDTETSCSYSDDEIERDPPELSGTAIGISDAHSKQLMPLIRHLLKDESEHPLLIFARGTY